MKFILSIMFVLATGISLAQSASEIDAEEDSMLKEFLPKVYAQIGQPFPEFSFTNNGKAINNNSLKGKVVLINFWFESCAPCMAEMRALNELVEKLKDHTDFTFVSITWEKPEIIKEVKEKYDLTFDVFSTTGPECIRLTFGGGYPTNIILDKTGTTRFLRNGGQIVEEKARENVMTILLPKIQSLF